LDVLSLMPQTNGEQPGEATCTAFTFMVLQAKRTL
jgi:ArsR family metal-binding transcriptional regulator